MNSLIKLLQSGEGFSETLLQSSVHVKSLSPSFGDAVIG